jgi:hypothetical protein
MDLPELAPLPPHPPLPALPTLPVVAAPEFGAQIKGPARALPVSVSAFVSAPAADKPDLGITRLLDRVQAKTAPSKVSANAGVAHAAIDDFFRAHAIAAPPAPQANVEVVRQQLQHQPQTLPQQQPPPPPPPPPPQAANKRRSQRVPLAIPSVAPALDIPVQPAIQVQPPPPPPPVQPAAVPFAIYAPPPLEQILAQQQQQQIQQQLIQQQQMLQAGATDSSDVFDLLDRAARSIVVHAIVALVVAFTTSYYVLYRYLKDIDDEDERTLRSAAIAGAVCALAATIWWVMTSSLVEHTEKQQPLVENPAYWQRYYLG